MKPFKLPTIDNYFGGKGSSGTYQQIINEIRPHDVRIVPFLGNCAITRHIEPSETIIGIEKSPLIAQAWVKTPIDDQLIIKNQCGIKFLEDLPPFILEHKKYVVYADPPYPLSSRKQKRLVYDHEMTDADHKRLLSAVSKLAEYPNVDVLISTYPNEMYRKFMFTDKSIWTYKQFQSTTRRGSATEWLLMNYQNEEGLLHDYSYLGNDYRERERIKIKIRRLRHKMANLPITHRNAIIKSLETLK